MNTSKKSTEEQQFEDYREALFRECLRLTSVILLYKHLINKKTDRLKEMNIAPAFFRYVFDAFFSIIIIWTNKLLNPRDKSERNLLNFLAFVENHRELFSTEAFKNRRGVTDEHWVLLDRKKITYQTIQDDRKKIKDLPALPSIELRRDKFHAHFDKEYFMTPSQINLDAPLNWGDLDKIIDVIRETFNKYSIAYDGSGYAFDAWNINDIDNVLDILHEHNKRFNFV